MFPCLALYICFFVACFFCAVVLEFHERSGHLPMSEQDMEGLLAARDSVEKETGVAVPDDTLR